MGELVNLLKLLSVVTVVSGGRQNGWKLPMCVIPRLQCQQTSHPRQEMSSKFLRKR